ncbi:hypothetical protein D9619_013077 [Psilocybe cf. subviscida]|uniref:Dynamin N-terminal domain-containing protein n=1 Tax=Psilocybe cf. subviscida TaxID=2480587 RepID=A0A8H5EVI3_9AGAR|nr:hypothetical protein D9619_013077 [Psilocybe cf. subviscida]
MRIKSSPASEMFRRATTKKGNNTDSAPLADNATSSRAGKSLIATSDYAQRCNALMEIQRELMAIRVSLPQIDLPRVAVIGGQSSGKSSLVEAVSGITVPRDSGTCTRLFA